MRSQLAGPDLFVDNGAAVFVDSGADVFVQSGTDVFVDGGADVFVFGDQVSRWARDIGGGRDPLLKREPLPLSSVNLPQGDCSSCEEKNKQNLIHLENKYK